MPWPPPPHVIHENTMSEKMRLLMPDARRRTQEIAGACSGIRAEIRELQRLPTDIRESASTEFVVAFADLIARDRRLYRKFLVRRVGLDPLKRRQVRPPPSEMTVQSFHSVQDAIAIWTLFDHIWRRVEDPVTARRVGWHGPRDVGEAAAECGAKQLVIVHMGGRYDDPGASQVIVDEIAQYYDGTIILGEDLMEVAPA